MTTRILVICIGMLICLASTNALAQRAGQNMTVRTGIVESARQVDLNDGNAVGGALVGGAFGAALTRSNSSSRRRNRNAALGAVIGGAASGTRTRPGSVFSVRVSDSEIVQIATEQTEIRVGDCVFVEQSGNSANIRRANPATCEPASADLLEEPLIEEELTDTASRCGSFQRCRCAPACSTYRTGATR